jgi:hypothetical protein
MDEEGYVRVKFLAPAIETFREAFPELPPADEMIVKMKLGECGSCGKDMRESEFGGIDPVGITDEGELIGELICQDCMEEGK